MPPRRIQKPETPQRIFTYGCGVKNPPGDAQLFYDRWAFANRIPIDRGAPTRLQLFRRLTDKLIPGYLEWHSWTERMMTAACENKWIALAGCAGSAKTFNVAAFACTWWLAWPEVSSVIFCSTTAKSLKKRGWSEVQRYYTTMGNGERFGNFVDSRMMWQCKKGDDRNAIVGIAVEDGDTERVADNIKGVHTKRQMIIIDEATAVSGAIYDAATNLWSYPDEFVMIIMGNPRSRLDQMGRFCEPLLGWSSVNIDTEEWETKPQIDGQTGIVLRFDAERSPNITEGKVVSKHLPTKEKVEARRNKAGSAEDPTYWSNDRGFWPPDGISNTVLTASAITAHDATGKHKFTGRWFMILGALDPAFGGSDNCTLRFGKMGEIQGGRWGVQAFPPIKIKLVASQTYPITYQIRDRLREHANAVNLDGAAYICLPENVGVDDTGHAGCCDVIQVGWSPKIIRIQFGGSPSEDPINFEDARVAIDVYDDKSAEMWFRVRDAVYHEQLKGLDPAAVEQFCTRLYVDNRTKIQLQPKSRDGKSGMKSYRSLFGRSPDDADTVAILLEVARQRGFRLSPMGETAKKHEGVEEEAKAAQEVYNGIDYQEEEQQPTDEYYQGEEIIL